MRHGLTAAIVAVAGAAVAVAAWLLWPGPARVAVPQARQYLNASACLLAGPDGITPGSAGGSAWRVMESASLASHVMVSYLPGKPADVPVLLNTFAERKCGVIIVTGGSRSQMASAAKANPRRRFILVTSSTAAGPAVVPPNAAVVSAASAPGRIDQEVTALAGAA